MGQQHVWIFLRLASLALGQRDRPVCDIPPVEILATAYITCYLPEDVMHNRSDFEVFHLRNFSSPVRVMLGTWAESKYAVNLQAGFIYDGSRDACSRIFTFRIPRVNNSHAGRYSCRPVGYDDADIKTCELVLKQKTSTERTFPALKGNDVLALNKEINFTDISATCSPSVVREGQQATVICRFGDLIKSGSFLILRYNVNDRNEPDVLLMCLWTTGGLECKSVQGYKYEIISNNHTAILRLPNVTSKQLGTYTCKSVTSHVWYGSCTLAFPAATGSEETETFFGRYKVYIIGAVSAILSAAVTVTCVIIIYKRGHTNYEHPRRSPADERNSYRKLHAMVYCKNTGTEEDNNLYEEVRDSPPSQRTPGPVTVSTARSVPGDHIPHIVTSGADDKEITPALSPRLRPEDSSIPEGEKNPTSPAPHPSGSRLHSVRHSSSSRQDQGGDSSPPDKFKYYLHPAQEAVCTVSEDVCQSHDLSEKSPRDAKIHDERSDYDGRQVARQSDTYLQPVNVSGNTQDPVSSDGSSR